MECPVILAKGKRGTWKWDWILCTLDFYLPRKQRPTESYSVRYGASMDQALTLALKKELNRGT
jgi:hypothetical protein